ncbi:MAG: glycosidase [Candidatus Paceibacterota bacterium]|jgi:predicted GH43/DUF377 family glycosyl hydrolase
MPKVLKKQKKIKKKLIKKVSNKKIVSKTIKKAGKNIKLSKRKTNKNLKKKTVKAVKKSFQLKLEKSPSNPIIMPRPYSWESKATFNPTAFIEGDKIHLIYRAIGDSDVSVLGYASSLDGHHLIERPVFPVYQQFGIFVRSGEPINYISGGGWSGGCEDPRVTLLGDTVYMLYTAFDGWGSVRIAMTSIKLSDFKNKRWNWQKPVLISPPGEIHKNWVLFPEKINGKFAILHSISPEILIDYIDNLNNFDGTKFIKSIHQYHPQWRLREKGMRGVGPAPIKTKIGWLVLYHAMEKNDSSRYKLWAMILDLNSPTKILYRSKTPILEPEEYYENEGFKAGVVYSCGAIVKDENLFVYYGGADSVACLAQIKLSELLDDLIKNKAVKLKKSNSIII